MDAAIACGEYQERNILSINVCKDQVPVLKIRGIAVTKSSRYPPFSRQRLVTNRDICEFTGIAFLSKGI